MAKKKTRMGDKEKADQRRRTAKNKIKACEKAMERTYSEEHKQKLKERIDYWRKA